MKERSTEAGAFRQQVRMAAVQVSGLRPEELSQALAYEVEPLSGIPAPEADVSYRAVVDPDPTVRVYDVVVRRRSRKGGASKGLDRWLRPACAFAAVVLLAVVADGVRLAARRAALEKTVAERRPLQAQLDRLKAEERAVRAQTEEIRSRRASAVRAQEEAAALRELHADILSALAVACGDEAVVSSIASGEEVRSLAVRAVGVSGEAAANVMQKLSASAAEKGWRLDPGSISGSGTGATVSFDFGLKRTSGR